MPELASAIVEITSVQSYSGPLPPAEETERYERVHPGFTGSWIKMAENEQAERFKLLARRDNQEFAISLVTLLLSLFAVIAALGGGVWLLSLGKDVSGFTSIGIGIASVLGGLFYRSKRDENSEKKK